MNIKQLEEKYGDELLLDRIEWRVAKKMKTVLRQERYDRRMEEVRRKYSWLKRLEATVIEEGRQDFEVEELYHMLMDAYYDARQKKRGTYDVQRVEVNLYDNLYRLAQEIHNRTYRPLRSEAFIVFDPVIREIFAASFRDRIVHHLLINICMDWWNRRFVRDSYSCRVGKGTDYGVRRMAHHIAVKSKNYTVPTYVVKMDIKGFFMSMEREKLLKLAAEGAHRQFPEFGPLGRLAVFLWKQIIMDNPLEQVRIRGRMRDWDALPRDKSLLFQAEGRGIVIGNLTSQLLSNIFLDALDRFVIYQLGYHHYGRYVDDFYVVVNSDELPQFGRDLERIRGFLTGMRLTLHPTKTKWLDVNNGVPYLGCIIWNGHIEKDKRYRRNYARALGDVIRGAKDVEVVTSYMGGCINYGCRRMQNRLWRGVGLEYEL